MASRRLLNRIADFERDWPPEFEFVKLVMLRIPKHYLDIVLEAVEAYGDRRVIEAAQESVWRNG